MKRKGQSRVESRASRDSRVTSSRPFWRRHWPSWLAACLVVTAGLASFQFWRATAPPPPVVNTAGFDPVIAAAIADARVAVLRSPRSGAARGRMGMVLVAHEVRPEARACFAQASALAPRDPRWPYYLALAQLPDHPTAAVTNLDRAVRLFPKNEFAPRLKLADTLFSLGRLDDAEAQFRYVLDRDPKAAPAALGLGKVMNARERLAEAAEFLEAATKDPSTRKTAHRLLINVNRQLNRTSEAGKLAWAMAALPNDEPTADPFLSEIEKLKTGEQAWLDRADDLMTAGRVPEAAELLEKTVRTYPNSDRALFLLGRARLRLGDAAGAEAILAQAVQRTPSSVEAQMQLGIVRMNRGRAKDAQRCFRAAIQVKPNLSEAWFNLGLSLGGDLNTRAESMEAFREAIRLKPNLIEAYLGLAIVLRANGQNQEAAVELQHALELEPEEPLRSKLLQQLKLTGQLPPANK